MTQVSVPAPARPLATPPRAVPVPTRTTTRARIQTRYQLLIGGALAIVLALITLSQASNAYSTTYERFRAIVEVNSTSVAAAERALQYVASVNQAAADYAVLTSDTPLFEQAQNRIFRDFSRLRDEMFILRGNLQSDEERAVFTVAETYVDSRLWRHVSNLVDQRSSDAITRQQYLAADSHVRSWISPALERLQSLNFDQMVEAGEQATGAILGQVFLLAIPATTLAVLLTYLSLRVRATMRRTLTPGIDAAMVLGWVLLIVMLGNLMGAPEQLRAMIQDAYRSVTGSSRVLVDANLANLAESGAVIDSGRAEAWLARYDDAVQRVELRLCGRIGCTAQMSFVTPPSNRLEVNSLAEGGARSITPADSLRIDGVIPLIGNVTYAGEARALETARLALLDYGTANTALRSQIELSSIEDGTLEGAVMANTIVETGTSQEAFNRLSAAIEALSGINRRVFDQIGADQQALLAANRNLIALAGYALLIVLVGAGVYHRYQEL